MMLDKFQTGAEAVEHQWEIIEMPDGRRVRRCGSCLYSYAFGHLPCASKKQWEGNPPVSTCQLHKGGIDSTCVYCQEAREDMRLLVERVAAKIQTGAR